MQPTGSGRKGKAEDQSKDIRGSMKIAPDVHRWIVNCKTEYLNSKSRSVTSDDVIRGMISAIGGSFKSSALMRHIGRVADERLAKAS